MVGVLFRDPHRMKELLEDLLGLIIDQDIQDVYRMESDDEEEEFKMMQKEAKIREEKHIREIEKDFRKEEDKDTKIKSKSLSETSTPK